MTDAPLHWLFSLERLGMKFGLENMSKLMRELGHPHRRFPSVLVAGTNGKGSVTAMVDTALRSGGYRSARYTSPHLVRLEERFLIDGREIETETLASAVQKVRSAVDALVQRRELDGPATFFECATAAAFELFASSAVDIAVLEVGLGGRLDATNIVTPIVCAITTIDFDHQAQLGSTIESIAVEKAGIIKPGVPVVTGRLPTEAQRVVENAADAVGAPVIHAHEAGVIPEHVTLALAGEHQRDNATVAVAMLRTLGTRGFPVDEPSIGHALETVRWPGRLERLRHGNCDVLLDAAHNPAGARALARYLHEIRWTDVALVFGAMADKDSAGMLQTLAPLTRRIICTTAPAPRAASAEALGRVASGLTGPGHVENIEDPEQALARACTESGRVVVAGSIFLIGPLRGILR